MLAPDPGRSDYGDCADWLAIVLELDADGGARLLHQWSERHARRRNLWAELGKRGIAPPASSGARDGRPPKRESARRD